MNPIIFALPGNEQFADELARTCEAERGDVTFRSFPDEETYIRVDTPVDQRRTIIVGTLARPNAKVLPLWLFADTLSDLGAAEVGLVAPYLAYMRQDARFQPGEGVTSRYVAKMMSRHVDWLTTVDPHLHRYDSLDEIYAIPTQVTHAAPAISEWLARDIERPLVIGPDEESEQWVADIASRADAPHIVLDKHRSGDRDVAISVPDVDKWHRHTPVLVDDIISTARTMAEATTQLRRHGLAPPICVGVHAIFADDAVSHLHDAGVREIVTTNTIPHATNAISVVDPVGRALRTNFT